MIGGRLEWTGQRVLTTNRRDSGFGGETLWGKDLQLGDSDSSGMLSRVAGNESGSKVRMLGHEGLF
jgi:hypothetical protein